MKTKKDSKGLHQSATEIPNNSSQLSKPHHQSSIKEANIEKRVKIYKNGDVAFKGLKVVISTDQFESVKAFLDSISEKIEFKDSAGKLYTLSGKLIQSMDELEDNKEYVAALNIFTPLLYGYTKFVTTATGEIKKESEDASTASTKVVALRSSRSVDVKRNERKGTKQRKKSLSSVPYQKRPLLGNTLQEDKIKATKVTRKGIATGGNLPLATDNNLSQCAKAKFTSPSVSPAATATVATTKRPGATKMKVRTSLNSSLSKCSLLSAGHRPSTISIKDRTPTPKPTGKMKKNL